MRRAAPLFLTLTLALPVAACGPGGGELRTFRDSTSYAIGLSMGAALAEVQDSVELARVFQAIGDMTTEGREPKLTQAEAQQLLARFSTQVELAQQQQRAQQLERNLAAGDAYREENAARAGVTTTETGLQIEVLEAGTGATPTPADRVRVHYRGTLVDGTAFDSSYDRGEPATFPVNGVIPGWTEALQRMQVGGKYRVVIPPQLGYGVQGAGPRIGPNATLVFEVELVGIEK